MPPVPSICRSIAAGVREASAGFLDLVYPRNCESCGQAAEGPYRWLCNRCARELPRVTDPCCQSCGVPFVGVMAVERLCPNCRDLEPGWEQGLTLLRYDGPARAIVQHIKYNNARHLLQDVAQLVRQREGLVDWLEGAVIVPVPLHELRLRERGYNQSAVLAKTFAATAPGARQADMLLRIRETATQTQLSREERAANVHNAFAMREGALLDKRLTYVLVDDVFTTGATLNACCSVLKAGGADKVRVLTLAHG